MNLTGAKSQDISSSDHVAGISASGSVLLPRPRRIYVSTAGTMEITNEDATTATLTLVAGTQLDIQPYKITALGGGAVVFGLY
jgi:hypothetical protein